jgi:hypothetical protein
LKWWIDKEDDLVGTTRDILLNVYLCDVRNYPEKIDSVLLTPYPPLKLPTQHVIVIKFVPNNYTYIFEKRTARYLGLRVVFITTLYIYIYKSVFICFLG